MQRFEDDIMLKIEEEIDRIHRREWLVSNITGKGQRSNIFITFISNCVAYVCALITIIYPVIYTSTYFVFIRLPIQESNEVLFWQPV